MQLLNKKEVTFSHPKTKSPRADQCFKYNNMCWLFLQDQNERGIA
jgi:hypothetical protein